jgi:hypothetical protein
VVTHHPSEVIRMATPSNDKDAASDDVACRSQDSIRGSSKRRKQHHLGTTTTTSHDEDHGCEAGSSSMAHISATMHSDRRSAWIHTDYLKGLLEEACPNHTYPVRQKLKDCGMMWTIMTSGSLT